jgi:hypothetical protein
MRFVIISPHYRHNSHGVRVLYDLQKHLVRLGEDAIVINEPIVYNDDDILVAPEIFMSPHDGVKIVRWYLAPPKDQVNYSKDWMSFSYDPAYHDSEELYFLSLEPFFKDQGLTRGFNAYYHGKGGKLTAEIPTDAMEITYTWPPTRSTMADFLNRCENLYLTDPISLLGYEAELCGCKPWLVKEGQITPYPVKKFDINVDKQVEKFIKNIKEKFYEKDQENVRRDGEPQDACRP